MAFAVRFFLTREKSCLDLAQSLRYTFGCKFGFCPTGY
jgi:hypothetical protein